MKNKYIITCTTAKEAEKLFKALEIIGFKWDTNAFNIENDYCWDVNRSHTLYKISYNKINFGVYSNYKCELQWFDYSYVDVDFFIKMEVKIWHRIRYWFHLKIQQYENWRINF